MIMTIAMRELRSMFLSPLAWSVLAVTQLIIAWSFFTQIDFFFSIQQQLTTMPNPPGVTDLVVMPTYEIASIILLMVTPLLTMRLISEERRNGSMALLLSSPVSMTQIVLGKFVGIVIFMLILVGMISLMPLSLMMGSTLDLGKLAAGAFALFMLLAAFSAAGLFLSSLTVNPVVAAVSSFGLLLLLWIINSNSGDNGENLLSQLSILAHFAPMLRGLINSADVAYFVLFIVTFLVLTIRQMDSQRLQA
ncbi:MAG: ABC transporter permease subunit [Gammaproteobacteria bacterium]|nr:ABC transporter permease [Gammaproteobacteria bacterium]NNJ98075.1 ABC transporter permease subunit [Gammaproteobacteria bacterium]